MVGVLKVVTTGLSLFFLLTFHLEVSEVSYDAFYDTDKLTFFSYVSDPSNFQTMNPTITELTVYQRDFHSMRIYYKEHLVQLPFVKNYAYAVYNIRTETPIWRIESYHRTCFLTDFLCLPSNSTVTVETVKARYIHYQEDISYACPWFLTPFCLREVRMQRQLIMRHLADMF